MVLKELCDDGVIAVVRLPDANRVHQVAEALLAGGVRGVEVTMTTSGALNAIRDLAKDNSGWIVGAGTIIEQSDAETAIANGAKFLVSPVFSDPVVQVGRARNVPVCPAAFSPTEIWHAQQSGAEMIKLFPAGRLGAAFLRDILAPLPSLKILPSGGITLDNAGEWIKAGAAAVSAGNSLVDPALVAAGKFSEITDRARRFMDTVAEARSR